jgi:DNA polymerase-3 subunit beta
LDFEFASFLVSGVGDKVSILFTDNQLTATLGETQLVSRLIDGQYPDYEQYLPTQFAVTVTADASELAHAVKVSGLFSQSSQSISLSYNTETQSLVVASGSQDVGESSIKLSAKVVGGDGTLLLNYRYIWDVVSGRSGEVTLHVVNETAPVILTFAHEEGYRYLIVPIKS